MKKTGSCQPGEAVGFPEDPHAVRQMSELGMVSLLLQHGGKTFSLPCRFGASPTESKVLCVVRKRGANRLKFCCLCRGAIIPSTPRVILPDLDDDRNHNRLEEDLDFPITDSQAARLKFNALRNNNSRASETGIEDEEEGYRFSVGQLPAWAKKQVNRVFLSTKLEPQNSEGMFRSCSPRKKKIFHIFTQREVMYSLFNFALVRQVLDEVPKMEDVTTNPATGPRGRWAQRADNQSVVIKSILDENLQLSLSDSVGMCTQPACVSPESCFFFFVITCSINFRKRISKLVNAHRFPL